MSNRVRIIWNGVTTGMIAVAGILAILLVGVKFAGLQVFTVLSGSMEPAYHVGSLLYVRSVEPSELEKGDVITFTLENGTVVTHRIVEVIPGEDASEIQFRTKGDANNVADGSPVPGKRVLGSPVFTIPMLGYLAHYLGTPSGTCLVISAGALLLVLVLLPDLLGEKKKSQS